MIEVVAHLRWGSHCCLRGGQRIPQRRWSRRAWSLSALLVVDQMIGTPELRANVYAFRLIFEARKLIETGVNQGRRDYLLAARDELLRVVMLLESDHEIHERRDQENRDRAS